MKVYDLIFICPKFYGYDEKLCSALAKTDKSIHFINYNEHEYFLPSLPLRILNKLLRFISIFLEPTGKNSKLIFINKIINNSMLLHRDKFEKFINNQLTDIKANKLVIVKGFGFNKSLIEKIKASCEIKYSAIYQWDPIPRYPTTIEIYSLFDKFVTYDETELSLVPQAEYHPVPVSSSVEKPIPNDKFAYDFIFVGSFTIKRYLTLKKISDNITKQKYNYYFQLYTRSKFIAKTFRFATRKARTSEEISELYSNSRVIVEISHPGQTGPTQRFYEAIMLGKKLLLINKPKKIPDFARKNIIPIEFIKNREKMDLDKLISRQLPIYTPNELGLSYESWARKILNE